MSVPEGHTGASGDGVLPVLAADVGGTFTDVVMSYGGDLSFAKVLSTPGDYSLGILSGVRQLLERSGAQRPLVVHGHTVATNAVLSRRELARTAVVTTRGFRDVLEIGRTKRPNLYELDWDKPAPLVTRDLIFEISERVAADGSVLSRPTTDAIAGLAAEITSSAADVVVVSLLNSYANAENEQDVVHRLLELAVAPVVLGAADLSREIGEYERTSTAVLNGVLLPTVGDYLGGLRDALRQIDCTGLYVMQSNGGLLPVDAAIDLPVTQIESGPAAGVLAAAQFARELDIAKAIAFDMGGTTAKACLIADGVIEEATESTVGGESNTTNPLLGGSGYVVRLPCFELSEVGSGGGSVAWLDSAAAIHVGPESAGASPGPACYGAGGARPTVTDADMVMGYLSEQALGGGVAAPDAAAAFDVITTHIADRVGSTPEQAAFGVFSVANANMARAVRSVSVERGYDPREFTLICFGGAGPVHAVATARELGIRRVLVPPSAGVFSALGMLVAPMRRDRVVSANWDAAGLDEVVFESELNRLQDELRSELLANKLDASKAKFHGSVEMHYRGQAGRLLVTLPDSFAGTGDLGRVLRELFEDIYESRYGHTVASDAVVISSLRGSMVIGSPANVDGIAGHASARVHEAVERRRPAYYGPGVGWVDTPVVTDRASLAGTVAGPLILEEPFSTTVIPPGCEVSLDLSGALLIDIGEAGNALAVVDAGFAVDVMRHRLEAIVDEMALNIAKTARSLIAREGHDFSTALCDPLGVVVAQGQGVLIHLGTVASAMQAVLAYAGKEFGPGDVFCVNDPYDGGTHLPDIITVRPLFDEAEVHLGFALTILHHSDISGGVPGGHATGATDLFQEGLIIPPVRISVGGNDNPDVWRLLLSNTRAPRDLEGDLRAQLAACASAEAQLRMLAGALGGPDQLQVQMDRLVSYTEQRTRFELANLPDGSWSAEDYLDDDGSGTPVLLAVDVTIDSGRVVVDFSRSADQIPNGLNCNIGTLSSAVFFGFRCLFAEEVPTNGGFARCFEIVTRPGSVVSARRPAPVAARGLTGFRLADLMFRVLAGVAPGVVWAAGEGGLSVVTMGIHDGDRRSIFMDTVGGGSGARPHKDGVEGIAPAIGNVRNSANEIMERDFPVRIHSYGFVSGTGGRGATRGANAIAREYELLGDQATAFCRSDRRRFRPWGLQGGGEGDPSTVELRRAGTDEVETLPPTHVFQMTRGDRLVVQTAGGGGFGSVTQRQADLITKDQREDRT